MLEAVEQRTAIRKPLPYLSARPSGLDTEIGGQQHCGPVNQGTRERTDPLVRAQAVVGAVELKWRAPRDASVSV